MKAEIDIRRLKKFISIFGTPPVFLDHEVIKSSNVTIKYDVSASNYSLFFKPVIVRMETVNVGKNKIPTGLYILIEGQERLPLAKVFDSIPAIVIDSRLSETEIASLEFLLNTDIEDLDESSIIQVVKFGYDLILRTIAPDKGKDPNLIDGNINRRVIEVLSELIPMSTQNLYRYVGIIRHLEPPLINLFKSGVLSLRAAYLISSVKPDVQLCVYDFILRYQMITVTEQDAYTLCRLMKEEIDYMDEQKLKEMEEQNKLLEKELANVKNQLAQARSKSKLYRKEILDAVDEDMRSGAGSYSNIPNLSTLLAIEDKFKSINSLTSSLVKTIYKATSVQYDFHNRELENLELLINKFVSVYNDISEDEKLAVVNESDVKDGVLNAKKKRGRKA
ncbi:hypothetical protein [Oribacterium sp. FC2011]|uniref:hypothetical protein n=1 Tax=Oribacterium sp. FC2011 TaxID=1408311 RepID=UPI0004E14B45|nr:hypothetical protein [Oribacterium sp. FC2011]